MSEQLPVTVAVRRSDGRTEQVKVGVATRTADGFSLQLGELTIGGTAEAPRASSSSAGYASARPPSGGGDGMVFPNYGRSKGAPIAGASMQDLEFYANGARRTLSDPSKERFHSKERALLAAIEAEMNRQRGGGGGGGGEGPDDVPPPGDEDAPY